MMKIVKTIFLIIMMVPVCVSASNKFYYECDKTELKTDEIANCNLIFESTDPVDSLYVQVKSSDEENIELSNFKKGELGLGEFFEDGKVGLYQLGSITGKNVIGTFQVKSLGKSKKMPILTFDKSEDGVYAYLSDDITDVEIATDDFKFNVHSQGNSNSWLSTLGIKQILIIVGFFIFAYLVISFFKNLDN